MDQYFDRLDKATRNEQLPVRIRFMIQDIVDMRRNKWQPRRIGKGPEGPRTIQQVREDAARDGCIYMPQENSPPNFTKVANPMTMINPFEGTVFCKTIFLGVIFANQISRENNFNSTECRFWKISALENSNTLPKK